MVVIFAGPVIMAGYALAFLMVDVGFRRLRVSSRAAYAAAGAGLPLLVFLLTFSITGGLNAWPWYVLLIVPGGLAGGLALGRARKPSSPAAEF